ncbi:MAG TPA: metallophosphoesterase [Candidatus Angelobacter sp.]|jgi:hypothetical protein|nr:metallophosphoesterase [Candidatus Angelobacter sp.]
MKIRIRIAIFLCIAVAGLQAQLPSGRALLISDIHLDPLADSSIVKQLIDAPVEQWTSIFQKSQQPLSTYGSDTNYPLFSSALKAAAAQGRFDFVIFTGDALRHDFLQAFISAGGTSSEYPAFAAKTEIFVTRELQRQLGVPVVVALGNNDSDCGDYAIPPNSPFLAAVADQLPVLMKSPDAKATFRFGGYFSVPHPTVVGQEIIVLNSVFWSSSYASCVQKIGDPGAAELDWLSWQLYAAKILNRHVTLVMHIPPGMDPYSSSKGGHCDNAVPMWPDRYSTRFSALMQAYSDVVQLGFAGHTHMDDFRISSSNWPTAPLRITPAISPLFHNNPGFSVLSYDLNTGAASDVKTYFISLSGPTPQWTEEYRFSTAYGVSGFNAAGLSKVTTQIRSGSAALLTFENNYAVSAPSPINASNWAFYSCAQTEFTEANYNNCVCSASSPSGK